MYLGAGEFWLTEAVYKKVKGVTEVIPGYMGGTVPYPTHELVATGTTGHAEVVKVTYDESTCSTETVLHVFFALHDPAMPNYSDLGIGSHYRKVIFYTETDEAEAHDPQNGSRVGVIARVLERVQEGLPEGVVISTRIMSAREFYPADQNHYGYYDTHPEDMYSATIIRPQIEALQARFADKFFI